MAGGNPDSELIRGDQLTGLSRWDLPSFDEAEHHVPVVREEPEDEPEDIPQSELEEADELEAPKPFTVEELEQIREEAYNEGFSTGEKDGFHAGQLKAQQEARNRMDARVAEFEQLLGHLLEPLRQQDEQIEDMLLHLVEHMVRQVVQRELKIDSSQVLTVLRGALKVLPMGAENIRIYLNPVDFEAVKALRERHEERWRLLEDEQLLPGGCRIETEHSQVDATLETRLEQLITQLFEQRREQRAHPPAADQPVSGPGPEPLDEQS